ncbi:MAG: redox-regulated ATPase YchF [Armatimonadetes bacterium]|nr:redox-regulated ATPase YchF [Armatimonadota bacterium]
MTHPRLVMPTLRRPSGIIWLTRCPRWTSTPWKCTLSARRRAARPRPFTPSWATPAPATAAWPRCRTPGSTGSPSCSRAQRAAELTGRHADRFTAALGEADMLAVVIRCFGDTDADGSPLDPVGALDEVMLELVFADLATVEKRLERIDRDLKKGMKELIPERDLLLRCKIQLEAEQPLSGLAMEEDEAKLLRGFSLLSLKPALILANVGEDDLAAPPPAALGAAAAERGLETISLCAQVEAEIAGLEPAEQRVFLDGYGIAEPARPRFIRTCYHALDLISFLTTGPDEARAWTIRRGTRAQQAAGTIHSDFERGFIRAETVAFSELDRYETSAACREAAVLRLEGRDYVVQDGDVITFRFNV